MIAIAITAEQLIDKLRLENVLLYSAFHTLHVQVTDIFAGLARLRVVCNLFLCSLLGGNGAASCISFLFARYINPRQCIHHGHNDPHSMPCADRNTYLDRVDSGMCYGVIMMKLGYVIISVHVYHCIFRC